MMALAFAAALTGAPAPSASPRTWCRHLAHSASAIAEGRLSGMPRIRVAADAALIPDAGERAAQFDLISLAYDGNAAGQASPAELAGITYVACMRGS